MTKSKSTRHTPAPTAANEDIPLSEQIRLAQASGILPAGSLQHPSSIRQRKPVTEPLVRRIPSDYQGATIEEITLGEAGTEEQQYDSDEDYADNDEVEVDAEDLPNVPWNPETSPNTMKIPTGIKRPRSSDREQTITQELDFSDEVFITIMYLIPLASLYLLFDILAHQSFNREPGWTHYAKRLSSAIPTIAILVFISKSIHLPSFLLVSTSLISGTSSDPIANRYQAHPLTAPLLMLTSFGAGCRLFWIMNKSNWLTVMKQAAPVVTLWILSVVQLPIGKLMISLMAVLAWYWWNGFEFALSLT